MIVCGMDITRFESQASRITRASAMLDEVDSLCAKVEAGQARPIAVTMSQIRHYRAEAVEIARQLWVGYRQSGQPKCDTFHALNERGRRVCDRAEHALRLTQQRFAQEDKLIQQVATKASSRPRLSGRGLSAPAPQAGGYCGLLDPSRP